MFPRRKRLSRSAFPSAIVGKRLSSKHFSAVSSREMKGYAVVVSKKTARLSVDRHLMKRRVLAALRELPLPSSLVVYPKSSALCLSVRDMKEELATLLSLSKIPR